MKKRYRLSLGELSCIEIADILITLWVLGLFLAIAPRQTSEYVLDWIIELKWVFFLLALIIGIKPLRTMMSYREKDITSGEARPKKGTKRGARSR